MSHKSKDSRISINLAIVCFLIVGFPPLASNFESKYALKSPPNIIFLFLISSILFKKLQNSDKVKSCSASLFGLYILAKTNISSPTFTSRIRIRPFTSLI